MEKNSTENARLVNFEAIDDDETNESPDKFSDENALEAEIIAEKPLRAAFDADSPDEKLSMFLQNLPKDLETKFIVTRLEDKNLAGQFRLPCDVNQECGAFYWNGDSDPIDLYAKIVRKHGGGHYRIRTKGFDGFVKNGTWTVTLADPPELSDKEKILQSQKPETKTDEQPRTVETSQFFVNPQPAEKPADKLENMRETIAFMREIREFEKELSPPPTESAPTSAVETKPMTKAAIALEFYERTVDEKARGKIIETLFGGNGDGDAIGEEKGIVAQIADYVVNKPDNALTVIQTLGSGLAAVAAPILERFVPKPPAPIERIPLAQMRQRPAQPAQPTQPSPTVAQSQPPAQETPETEPAQPTAAPVPVVPLILLED